MSKQAFDPVPSPFNFAEAEHAIIRFWKEQQIYRESLKQRKDAPPFVFYEGPPTANGKPHPGHCLTRTIKDIFPRYKTMAGFFCERKAGWDTHGLPVEIEVCKELGILEGGKAAIEEYGIERFNRACIESVFRYQREWEELTDRIGFWVDLEDAYVTYHQSYVESVWWALKTLFDRGLLYQGHKVVWWWAQGGTALSAGEVGEGYRDTDDPAVTVSLTLTEESAKHIGISHAPVHLLVWTTTPWTLSSNCAACVGPELDYAIVKTTREDGSHVFYILAAGLVEKYFGEEEIEILRTMPGEQLLGLHYTPLFHYDTPQKMEGDGDSDKHWIVIPADFVDLATGTGIVHMAPAFGEDDYRVCKEQGIGFLCFVKPDGTFDARVTDVDPFDKTPIAGQFCKDADKGITRILKERGQILRHETYRHPYPFCPRADQDPLIQYARKSWFIRTSQFVDEFVANNKQIAWQPEHIRDGRFGNFLENNVDWALSRERYWGTPLPVWVCDKTGHMEAISNYDELLAKPDVQGLEVWQQAKAENPELSDHLRVHKPYIDAVHYQSPQDPAGRMRRVTEVIDVWFDAGSMPFAQWGYPHKPGSEAQFQDRFPADFISEAIDQTRGWFYALLAISTVVFGKDRSDYPHPFRNCICLGHILGEDGLKLSKRLKNYSEPGLLFEKFSADALRFSFIAKNPPTSSTRLSEKIVEESQRELLIRWYNVYSFFTIYANLDGFDPSTAPAEFLKLASATPGDIAAGDSDSKGQPGRAPAKLPSEAGRAGDVAQNSSLNTTSPPTHEATTSKSAQAQSSMPTTAYAPRSQRSELDRWILHEFDRATLTIRAALDNYESYPAARAISDTVDSLSNWYVRRSRARFWAGEWSQDKADAYWTLYECLITLARLAAPFTPFFSEVTWQNLVKPLPGAAKSVHLATYPEADPAAVDHTLLEEMAATREAVSLGLSARRTENIKVRQPLSRCDLILGDPRLQDGLEKHRDLITEELNVKTLEFSSTPEQYVTYEVKPNFRTLGPKYGKKINAIRQALATGDGAALFRQVQDTGAVTLEIDGETLTLTPEEVEVRLTAKEGFAAAQGKHLVAILATEITPELRREGWVRELIRFIQDLRKEQELAYDARIHVTLTTPDAELARVAEEYKATIAAEVLAETFEVVQGPVEGGSTFKVEGSDVGIKIA